MEQVPAVPCHIMLDVEGVMEMKCLATYPSDRLYYMLAFDDLLTHFL